MSAHWLAVASADHVRIGRAEGFMQVNHGKAGPLRRLRPGDGIVYYSPTEVYGVKGQLRSFTAIGVIKDGEPYQGDMGSGFRPYRRDVAWFDGVEAPIAPLLDRLDLTAGNRNWGYKLRFGLIEISAADFRRIAAAMAVPIPVQSC
jgi:hypothetical protein